MPKNIDRRQLLKSTAAGVAAIGGGMVAAKTATACPLIYGPDGTPTEYFCISTVLQKLPLAWRYRYDSCVSTSFFIKWGAPNWPNGDCSDAANDPYCATAAELQGNGSDLVRINGEDVLVCKKLNQAALEQIRASV